MSDEGKYDVESLLGNLFRPQTLRELFENKLAELNMPQTTALKMLGFGSIPLKRLLDGSETMVDLAKLFKLADFLQLSREHVVKLYAASLERIHFPVGDATSPKKVKFIKDNFDLAVLRKAGFINSISDFGHIEQRLLAGLGLRSIFEYRKPPVDLAFSSMEFNPDHQRTRAIWVQRATACFRELENNYPYEREQLANFFPEIRWQSTNPEVGLHYVVKTLFRLGITVIFLPHLENLKVRGATMIVNDRPCIALTNYYDLYPSLWFTLLHELYHVFFDLDDIRQSTYHLSDDSNDQTSVRQREALADNFAREYLFPREKLDRIRPKLMEKSAVYEFARENHVHPSIIYAFHAYDKGTSDRKPWARMRQNSPSMTDAIANISFLWHDPRAIEVIAKQLKRTTYN